MSDSLFTIHSFKIPFEKYGDPIYLIPFGDIHRFAPLCHEEKWLEFLDWARKKPRCYFLGMGDYDDMYSGSERISMKMAQLHESSEKSLYKYYRKRTMDLVKELRFMEGRLIGLIEGNHYADLENGTTTTQLMCDELGCQYLGVSSFINLQFKCGGRESSRVSIKLWAHHGRGGGGTPGASLNTLAKMERNGIADIFLMGHDHQKKIDLQSKLELSDASVPKLHSKKILFARTGSFLKGYVHNEDSYVAKANLCPTDIGVVKLEMTPKRYVKSEFGRRIHDICYIDLHASL